MKSTSPFTIGVIFLISFNAFVNGQSSSDSLHCYICELEHTSACQETADVSVLTSADCKDLPYPKSILNETEVINDVISKSVDGKIRGSSILESVFQQNGQRSATDEHKYACLTVIMTIDDKKAITRGCHRVPKAVKDVCDFIKQDVQEPVKIKKCTACTKDYCNSSPGESLMSFLMLVIISTVILKT